MSKQEQELMRSIKRRWAIQCSNGELFCFLCGKQIKPKDKYNADHWIPRALGGKTTEENLKPAHVSCNSKKGCLSPEEFLLHKDEILNNKYYPVKEKEITTKKEKSFNLGDTIYYIQKVSNNAFSKIIIKKGVILGYAEEGCVLIKDLFLNANNEIASELITVIPLSKKEAFSLKAKCDNKINSILQLQNQYIR